jgi:aryl-alcohol dehydrogenase-like predicted oxidoreductase
VSGELFGDLGMTEEASFRLMDLALEHGITFFGTADVYGWDQGIELSEGVIGRWLAAGGGRREKVVLATKVFHASTPGWPDETWPNQKGLVEVSPRRRWRGSMTSFLAPGQRRRHTRMGADKSFGAWQPFAFRTRRKR